MKYIKEYNDYDDDDEFILGDYWNLTAGDILIGKKDVYTKKPIGTDKNWTSTRLVSGWEGDKLFVPKGGKKKIRKIEYGRFYLSGFSPGVDVETIREFFTIKEGKIKQDIRKYNL